MKSGLVTIICGETGSGKSTRIPQFLYDHGLVSQNEGAKVVVTQPRRIAAVSLSKRVSEEVATAYLSERPNSDLVGYQVRWQHSKNHQECPIKFVTDGILLNEMMSDPLLSQYQYVVIDEAHERKMVSDVLVGLVVQAGRCL